MGLPKESLATGSGDDIVYLFAPEDLTSLSAWSDLARQLDGLDLIARPLKRDDYQHGYLELLSQLTTVGEITKEDFEARFDLMKSINETCSHYNVVVIEDKASKTIIAASTLFLELKFIHQCSKRARLEEVAVLDTFRGKKVGQFIVRIIVELAREVHKCYKLTLDCTDELIAFYDKNGFVRDLNMLCRRFDC